MMALDIQNSIAQLKTDIFMHVRHRTLQKYTGDPIVNENQLFYLLLPYFNQEQWSAEHNEAVITASIICAMLDVHSMIQETEATSQQQQLTVLAGDFYSGRHYQILAESGNIALIRLLSQGVVKRCEEQVRVYERFERSLEQWYDTLTVMESVFIEQVFRLYHFEKYVPIVQKGLLICRLHKEIANIEQGIRTAIGEAMLKAIEKQYAGELPIQLYRLHIQTLNQEINELLNDLSFTVELKEAVQNVSQWTRKV